MLGGHCSPTPVCYATALCPLSVQFVQIPRYPALLIGDVANSFCVCLLTFVNVLSMF